MNTSFNHTYPLNGYASGPYNFQPNTYATNYQSNGYDDSADSHFIRSDGSFGPYEPESFGGFSELSDKIAKDDKVAKHGKILFKMLKSFEDNSLSIDEFRILLAKVKVESLAWKNKDGNNSLHTAAADGNAECLKELLKLAKYKYREVPNDNRLFTPLHLAAGGDNPEPECVKLLLEDSKPGYRAIKDCMQYTALTMAIVGKSLACLKELLKGSKPEYREVSDEYLNTPLHHAACDVDARYIPILLKDANPQYREMRDDEGSTALHAAAQWRKADCIVELLIDSRPEYRKLVDKNKHTALHIAVLDDMDQTPNPRCIRELLKDSEVEYREMVNKNHETALHIAVREEEEQHENVSELLIGSRYKFREMRDKSGNTALHIAVANNYVTSVKILLKDSRPEYREMVNKNGETALHIASYNGGSAACIGALLRDARPHYREIRLFGGGTALHIICMGGSVGCFEQLLKDSRPEYREMVDDSGSTALHRAAESFHDSIDHIRGLITDSRPEYYFMNDKSGATAAQIANWGDKIEVVRFLLKYKYIRKIVSIATENIFATQDKYELFWANDTLVKATLVWIIGDEHVELTEDWNSPEEDSEYYMNR